MQTFLRIEPEDFDQAEHYAALATGTHAGAVVTFVGRVRDFDSSASKEMWLEHYPAMTKKVLQRLMDQAGERWPLFSARIVHRIGRLPPGEQIVFVGVSAAHRKDAFEACEFLIDFLKTEAPFWKREGEHWVAAKHSDEEAKRRWQTDSK